MVETLQETLVELGVPEQRIHSELFFDERIELPPESDSPDDDRATMTFTLGGRTSQVAVDEAGPPLLDYARTVRPEVPFACKGGMCATCKARVITGEVTMDKNYALGDEQVEAGFILSCQSHPVGNDIEITYDN